MAPRWTFAGWGLGPRNNPKVEWAPCESVTWWGQTRPWQLTFLFVLNRNYLATFVAPPDSPNGVCVLCYLFSPAACNLAPGGWQVAILTFSSPQPQSHCTGCWQKLGSLWPTRSTHLESKATLIFSNRFTKKLWKNWLKYRIHCFSTS